jgi:FMN-dependent NADH-azoreductase
MKLLHIDSSISGEASASRQLSAAIVTTFKAAVPGLEIIARPRLRPDPSPRQWTASHSPTCQRAGRAIGIPDEKGATALDEFLAADIVVIGAPMYNFTVPSQLKACIDRILIAGRTFRYGQAGPVGLLAGGKRVVIASSRGGLYAPGMPFEDSDFQERYLRAVFAFIGIEDFEIVRAEGLAFGPEQREAAMRAALAAIPSAVTTCATKAA